MPTFKERDLNKGQLRKLTALRKSLGKGIADNAFGEWLASTPKELPTSADKNAEAIAKLLNPPVLGKKIDIPRRGRLPGRLALRSPEFGLYCAQPFAN